MADTPPLSMRSSLRSADDIATNGNHGAWRVRWTLSASARPQRRAGEALQFVKRAIAENVPDEEALARHVDDGEVGIDALDAGEAVSG